MRAVHRVREAAVADTPDRGVNGSGSSASPRLRV